MTQFLDKGDGKWHITMFVDIPRITIRNYLNFRIYSTTSFSGITIKDPPLISSNYVFHITPNLLGKKVFFNLSFSKASIANIDVFRFGLCDENIGWHHSTFFDIKNEYRNTAIIYEPIPTMALEPVIYHQPILSKELEELVVATEDSTESTYILEPELTGPVRLSVESEPYTEIELIPGPVVAAMPATKTGYQKKAKRK